MNNMSNTSEHSRLLHTISVLDFTLVDLKEYLDTHPYDAEALRSFQHYNKLKQQAVTNYTVKFGPLNTNNILSCSDSWKWALQPMPWEVRCN